MAALELSWQEPASEADLMRHALRAAGVGCWDLDLTTGNVWRSAEYDSIWGNTQADALMPLDSLLAGIVPEDREAVRIAFEQVPRRGSLALEKRIERANDKSVRWIRLSGQAYYRADKLAGIAGVIADVTPEHQAREKLRHAEKMESLGRMAREVAHDFNNLLMVIGVNLEMLGEQIQGDRANRLVSAMAHGMERGTALTQHLMDFARPAEVQVKIVSVDEIIASAWGNLARAAGDGVDIARVIAPASSCYCADPDQLIAAMTNLVDNAREAMPDGGRLVVSTIVRHVEDAGAVSSGVRPGDYVGISFSDNGRGIAPDIIARIFEPMFSTKVNKKGHGFGLSEVYSFASSSGGFVTAESEPGQGTTVVILLPLASAATH